MASESCADTTSAVFVSTYLNSGDYNRRVPSISGKWITTLRERAGFDTQGALASKAKIDPSKLSRIENDKPVNLTLKTLERLAKTLKVSTGELFATRPEGASGHVERPHQHLAVLENLTAELDAEAPAEDTWRGDVLKAIAALNRALRRGPDSGTAGAPPATARR
jgi:transcriptional regulator with XRE-family HTH domain